MVESQDSCPFGDGFVYQSLVDFDKQMNLSQLTVTCQDTFNLISKANKSISGYCADPNFGHVCCNSCKSKKLHLFSHM